MSSFNGCHDVRNMVHIKEIECPQCREAIEVFIKDGNAAEDCKCEKCGFVIEVGTTIAS